MLSVLAGRSQMQAVPGDSAVFSAGSVHRWCRGLQLCTLADLLLRALWQPWGLPQPPLSPHGPSGRHHSLGHWQSQLHLEQQMVRGQRPEVLSCSTTRRCETLALEQGVA